MLYGSGWVVSIRIGPTSNSALRSVRLNLHYFDLLLRLYTTNPQHVRNRKNGVRALTNRSSRKKTLTTTTRCSHLIRSLRRRRRADSSETAGQDRDGRLCKLADRTTTDRPQLNSQRGAVFYEYQELTAHFHAKEGRRRAL